MVAKITYFQDYKNYSEMQKLKIEEVLSRYTTNSQTQNDSSMKESKGFLSNTSSKSYTK